MYNDVTWNSSRISVTWLSLCSLCVFSPSTHSYLSTCSSPFYSSLMFFCVPPCVCCPGQEELGCEHNGVSYQEGEVFQPSCNTQCKCAGGGVTCVPLCSEDVRLPSSDCPYPQRVQLPGKCCKEWVCENMDNSMQQDGPGGEVK